MATAEPPSFPLRNGTRFMVACPGPQRLKHVYLIMEGKRWRSLRQASRPSLPPNGGMSLPYEARERTLNSNTEHHKRCATMV